MDDVKERDASLLEINLHDILRKRMPRRISRFVPDVVISLLERIIHQDELNAMLRAAYPSKGSEFSRKILEHLQIGVEVNGLEDLPVGRYMFASNHPLGGLDGIALIAVLGEKYGDEGVRFLVNDLLMNVEPLRGMFLPVNKFGSQGRKGAETIIRAMDSDMQILQFPAGLVSRLGGDGVVRDLDWQKSFVTKAVETHRDIVPVRFEALNSMSFYKTAKWRKKLGLKINVEQILLPGELCKCRGKRFRIVVGTPVRWADLAASGKNARTLASELKETVYSM